MAVIKNIIQTQFTSTGAAKVTKDVETLNRSQTRLGQASASAGRTFSSQAQGLGGLVGAYAAAAATVFALQQAFSALAKAAQAETIVEGTKTLAAQIGQSGPRILKSIDSITQGQLTLAEAAQNANIALSAGFNTRQIEGFTTVALKASKALGRDFTDSLQRITRGVAKLEPELLDELGIFTRIEPAVQAYAKQLGVSASSLNEFQRRQAFANAAIEEGLRKFGAIDTTSASAQKTLERLQVQISELATVFSQLIANALVPFISFITDNLGNSLVVFGGLLGLVFKRAITDISAWAGASINKLAQYSDKLAATAAKSKSSFEGIKESVAALNVEISKRGGLSAAEGRFAQKGVERDVAAEAARARQRFLAGTQLTPAEIKKDIDTLKLAQNQLEASGKQQTAAYKDATMIMNSYQKALDGAGTKVKALTILTNGLNAAVKALSIAFTFLNRVIGSIFLIVGAAQLLGTLFDVDLLVAVKNLFVDLSQANENLKQGFLGLTLAAAGGSEALIKRLKEVGATDKQLEELPKTIQSLRKEIDSANISSSGLEQALDSWFSSGQITDQISDTIKLVAAQELLAETQARIAEGETTTFFGLITTQSKADIEALKQRAVLLEAEIARLKSFPESVARVGGELSRITGLGTEQIANLFKRSTTGIIDLSNETLEIFGQTIQKINEEFTLEGLNEQQLRLVETGIIAQNTVNSITKDFNASAVSITNLGTQISSLESNIAFATEEYLKQKAALELGTEVTAEAAAAVEKLAADIFYLRGESRKFTEVYNELVLLDNAVKNISQTFSADISKQSTVFYEGIVSLSGEIATTQEQQIANQNELLFTLLDIGSIYSKLQGDNEAINQYMAEQNMSLDQQASFLATINEKAAVFNKTMEAAVGRVLDLAVSFKKVETDLLSATKNLNSEIRNLTQEQRVLDIKLKLDATNLQFQLDEQLRNLQIQQLQADISLVEAKESAGALTAIEAANQVNEKQAEILRLQVEAENKRFANVQANIEAERRLNVENFIKEAEAIKLKRDIAINEARQRVEALKTQASQFKAFLNGQGITNAQFITSLADVFSKGATAIALAIKTQMEQVVTPDKDKMPGKPVETPELDKATSGAEQALANYEESQKSFARAQTEAALKNAAANSEALKQREAAEKKVHEGNLARLATEDNIRNFNHQAALKQEKESAEDKAEMIRELYEAEAEAIRQVAVIVSNLFELVNGIASSIFEGRISQIRRNEQLLTDSLASVTERLNSAQSDLNSALEDERSLKQQLVQETDALVKSQTVFLEALGKQGESIKAASKDYVDNLLKQKNSIMAFADANRRSIALGKQVSSLENSQITLQEQLQQATEKRTKLEEKLTKVQQLLGIVSDQVSGKLNTLADTISKLGDAAAKAAKAEADDKSKSKKDTDTTQALKPLVDGIGKAVGDAVATATQEVAKTATQSGIQSTALTQVATDINSASALISTALSGFQIGNLIGSITGNEGLASGIGGAIGSVIGTVFQAQIAGFFGGSALTGAVSSAVGGTISSILGTVFTAAIPVLGSILGALVGGLFTKKPSGQATGELTSEGFTTTSKSGRKISAEALASIPEQALGSIVTALESAGIQFTDTVTTSINFYKKGISQATLEFSSGFAETFRGGTVEKAGEFFIDAFFKGITIKKDAQGLVTFRSLVVDALIPSAENIQAALDQFASLSNETEKTKERFEEGVRFASEFNNSLAELRGPAVSTAEAVKLIKDSAIELSRTTAVFYRNFLADTKKTFGESSQQYLDAEKAVQSNALAQLGLAQVTKNGETSIVSLQEAQSDLNAGFLLVTDIVTKATSSIDSLKAAGFDNVGSIITQSINVQLSEAVEDTAKSLTQAIETLKNPAKIAVTELEAIVDNGVARISSLEGVVDGILKETSIDPQILAQAEDNVRAAEELTGLEIAKYIDSVSEASLRAIIASDKFSESIKNLAEAQLSYLKLIGAQKATASLISLGKALTKTLSQTTNEFKIFRVEGLLGFATDLDTLTKKLGQDKITPFTLSLNRALIDIANGVRVTENIADSFYSLNDALDAGTINSEQYAAGIEEVITTTESYIDLIRDLVAEYDDTVSQIATAFNQSKDKVLATIQDLGDTIISLTRNISSQTSEILGIYDDTLASVAESGNELFNLRDTAKTAFETAAKAVSEFEKSNKLSGKSASVLRDELRLVEQGMSDLLAAGNLDFSGFVQLSQLSAKQSALQREIKSVVSVETEYEKLLSNRAKAVDDLAFVESTLASLQGDVIDTRKQESDIIARTKEATTTFVSAQQDLQSITELLAESNFNLNQVRIDEESAVQKVRTALTSYNQDLESLASLLTELGGESGAALRDSFIEAATSNAEIVFSDITSDELRQSKIRQATDEAAAAFSQLEALASQVSQFFEPSAEAFNTLEVTTIALTSRFNEFSQDIVKYLETEGLARFYGSGGIFFQFKEALLETIKTQGFDVLTASGGPLDTFNSNLVGITQAINSLTESGSFLDISLQAVTTSLGTFISAVGTDLEQLTTGYIGLSIVGQNINDTTPVILNLYAEGIGNLNAALDASGNLSLLLEAPEVLNSLVSAVTLIDSELQTINLEVTAENIKDNLSTSINIIDSALGNVDISVSSNSAVNNIVTSVNLLDSTLSSIDITSSSNTGVQNIDTAINTINSALESINFTTASETVANNVNQTINTLESTISDINFTNIESAFINSITTTISAIESTIASIDLSDISNSAVNNINTSVSALQSTLSEIDFSTISNSTVENINNSIIAIESAISNADFTEVTNSSVNTINSNIQAVNSSLNNINFTTVAGSIVDSIATFSRTIDSTLQEVDFTTTRDSVVKEITAINENLRSTLTEISFADATNSTVAKIVILADSLNSSLNSVAFTTATDSVVEKIAVFAASVNSSLTEVSFTTAVNSTIEEIVAVATNIGSALENVQFVDATTTIVDEITAINTNINSSLSGIDITSGIAAAANKISLYNIDINQALGTINLTKQTDAVKKEIITLDSINLELGKISYTVNLTKATTGLNSVGTDINSSLLKISFSTNLTTASKNIDSIPTTISGSLKNVGFATDLATAKTNLAQIQKDLKTELNAYNFKTEEDAASKKISNVATTINTALKNINITDATKTFDALVKVFTPQAKTSVSDFRTAISSFASMTNEIKNTRDLSTAVAGLAADKGNMTKLTDKFKSLREEVDKLSGGKGIDELKNIPKNIATDLETAWNTVKLKTGPIPVTIDASVTATLPTNSRFTLDDTNSGYLKKLSSAYPALKGADYVAGKWAKGGYITGPGTSTSDSVPARLSTGEFVVNAQSTQKVGRDFLEQLNLTGDLESSIAASGRKGDTEVAHINKFEKSILEDFRGGKGSYNPSTGLLEYFPLWSGALGKQFADKESDLLWKTYGHNFFTDDFSSRYSSTNYNLGRPERIKYTSPDRNKPWGSYLDYSESYYNRSGGWSEGHSGLFSEENRNKLKRSQISALGMTNEILKARSADIASSLQFQYTQDWRRERWGSEDKWNTSKTRGSEVQTGWGPYSRFSFPRVRGYPAVLGGWKAKSAQAVTQMLSDSLGISVPNDNSPITKTMLKTAISEANKQYGNFTDLYMLSDTKQNRPSASRLSSGGIVSNLRDSVPAMLEEGEFVLRKAAVDRMGIDNAYKLNASGDIGGETNVEVNITNNGNPVSVAETPRIRKENGKIVLDIILEDIRNNGPIRQQIRSIR